MAVKGVKHAHKGGLTWITMLLLPLSFQSAVGFEYTGKTEKHASQKGDVPTCFLFACFSEPHITCSVPISLVWQTSLNKFQHYTAMSGTWRWLPRSVNICLSLPFFTSLLGFVEFPNWIECGSVVATSCWSLLCQRPAVQTHHVLMVFASGAVVLCLFFWHFISYSTVCVMSVADLQFWGSALQHVENFQL